MKKILQPILILSVIIGNFILIYFLINLIIFKDVPLGAPWKKQNINEFIPEERYHSLVAWAQIATKYKERSKTTNTCLAIIDYLKVIEVDRSGEEKIVYQDDYEQARDLEDSGLFIRGEQWFANDERDITRNAVFGDGSYLIDACQEPNKVVHWWTDRIERNPESKYFVEARFKIKAPASLQLGIDYWLDGVAPYNGYDKFCTASNNCQYMVSRWFGDTDNKFITVRAPVIKQ